MGALAVVDCPTGLAGNMLLAALFDCGLPDDAVHEPLAALGLGGLYRLQLEERRSVGLRGLHLEVEPLEQQPPHRHWASLREQIQTAPLDPVLRSEVLKVFGVLAEAEAAVHGSAPEQVHFHEVGALDALVDVVGVCAGLRHFGVERLICSPPPAGHGQVTTAHGLLPVPVPAVLELATRHGVSLASSAGFPPAELTTPTGLALMVALAEGFGAAPALTPSRLGIGLGTRELDRPNQLRLLLAEAEVAPVPALQTVVQQQAQIDDATPEDLAFLQEALREAGALEVFAQPVLMKKGRAGSLITALAWPEQAEALRAIWWRFGSSLGVREELRQRWALPRQIEEHQTPWGPVRFKTSTRPDGSVRRKPEFEDLVRLAEERQLPLDQLRQALLQWREEQR